MPVSARIRGGYQLNTGTRCCACRTDGSSWGDQLVLQKRAWAPHVIFFKVHFGRSLCIWPGMVLHLNGLVHGVCVSLVQFILQTPASARLFWLAVSRCTRCPPGQMRALAEGGCHLWWHMGRLRGMRQHHQRFGEARLLRCTSLIMYNTR